MAEIEQMNTEDARALTDKIKFGVEAVWHLIEQAYTSRAWAALGYPSWVRGESLVIMRFSRNSDGVILLPVLATPNWSYK